MGDYITHLPKRGLMAVAGKMIPTKKPKSKPVRIQRKRTKGWRMPKGAIYVGRPSKFQNMCKIGVDVRTAEDAVFHFRRNIANQPGYLKMVRDELRGKDLACWCDLDQPYCHADVLLEIANK